MGAFSDKIKSMFQRRKPVTVEEAEDLADWVNEGGTFDPKGPPEVADDENPARD